MAIVAFSVDSLAATNDSGRFVIGDERSQPRPRLCRQLEHTFHCLALQSVILTEASYSRAQTAEVDASDARLNAGELQAGVALLRSFNAVQNNRGQLPKLRPSSLKTALFNKQAVSAVSRQPVKL